MTSQPTPYDNVAAAVEQLTLYVVALERAIASPSRPDGGVTDTPGLGVLMALELFGPLRPRTLAELLNMRSGTTSKRIERLVRASFVDRRRSVIPGDRRSVVVEIRDAGRLELARIERLTLAMGAGLLRALQLLRHTQPATPAASADPEGYPALGALFRFVSLVDQSVIRAVGDHDLLHPSDPRPLLLLVDLDRNGPRPAGSVPGLVDRSRSATSRLLSQMTAASLIDTTPPTAGAPGGLTCISADGQRALQSVIVALSEDLVSLQPAIGDLVRALADGPTPSGRT
jgi:DNA-binding MarR family transcriptional regulator